MHTLHHKSISSLSTVLFSDPWLSESYVSCLPDRPLRDLGMGFGCGWRLSDKSMGLCNRPTPWPGLTLSLCSSPLLETFRENMWGRAGSRVEGRGEVRVVLEAVLLGDETVLQTSSWHLSKIQFTLEFNQAGNVTTEEPSDSIDATCY